MLRFLVRASGDPRDEMYTELIRSLFIIGKEFSHSQLSQQ